MTSYLLVFYLHKTADEVTMNNGKYGWEKTYFCKIHYVLARNEMKLLHVKEIFYSLSYAMMNVKNLRDCCRTYWPYLMAYYMVHILKYNGCNHYWMHRLRILKAKWMPIQLFLTLRKTVASNIIIANIGQWQFVTVTT